MWSVSTRLEAIAAPVALWRAWRGYRAGKRRRPAVARFELDCERHVLTLSRELLGGSYRHGRYRLLRVDDPKPRLIAVAGVRDRVVHRALYDALSPEMDRAFIADSYACIPGRGGHRAVLRFLQHMRRHRYLVHLDVHRFFPSVDHATLRALLARRVRDRRVLVVFDEVLRTGDELYRRPEVLRFFELSPTERPRGLPIGNLTSQWWGNVYMDGLDRFVKRELGVAGYCRYLDDMVLFADEASKLRGWRDDVREWLVRERRLKLKPGCGQVRPTRLPHTWLGHRVTRAGYDLGPKAIRRFRKGLRRLAASGDEGRLRRLAASGDEGRLRRTLASWNGAISF